MLHMERLPSDFFPLFSHQKNNSFPPIFLLRWDGGNAGKDFGRETTTEVLETAKVGVFWILDFRFVALAASFFFLGGEVRKPAHFWVRI